MEEIIRECLKTLDDMKNWEEIVFGVVCRTAQNTSQAVFEALDDEFPQVQRKGIEDGREKTKSDRH